MSLRPETIDQLRSVFRQEVQSLVEAATPRWMTIEVAGTYSSLSTFSIRRLLSRHQLTKHRPLKGRILIDRLELDNVIASATEACRVGRGLRKRVQGSP